jgi:hypothetical protein
MAAGIAILVIALALLMIVEWRCAAAQFLVVQNGLDALRQLTLKLMESSNTAFLDHETRLAKVESEVQAIDAAIRKFDAGRHDMVGALKAAGDEYNVLARKINEHEDFLIWLRDRVGEVALHTGCVEASLAIGDRNGKDVQDFFDRLPENVRLALLAQAKK